MSRPAFLACWEDVSARAEAGLPEPVLQAARRSWFDTAAATAAGVRECCTRAALASTEAAPASLLSSADAALVFGAASHAIDYDDVCMLATCHPSAPVVSALLALLPLVQRECLDTNWGEVLSAFAVGTETTLRLGEWLGFRHYTLGFHATSTLGSVGAAAAVASLLRLPQAQKRAALSIGASYACGLRANFGTDTKPLHVGFAAAAGVRAALLARAGVQASDDVWGPTGFFHAFNGGAPQSDLPWSAGAPFALVAPGFELKRFPSCYLTHRLIAGVLKIRARQELQANELVEIEIEMPLNGTTPLKHPNAGNGLEAKFSGPYCAAAAWVDGKVELASFVDTAVQRQQLRNQMQHVVLRERTQVGETLDTAPVKVMIRGNGWRDEVVVDWAPGSLCDPFTREELLAKWHDCTQYAGMLSDDVAPFVLLDASPDVPAAQVLLPLRSTLLAAINAQ
jgi:2-methylcitrate dehydratase PrpD